MLGGAQKENDVIIASSDEESILFYEEHLENRIKTLCEGVKGVSRVRVMVTLDGGFENVYARDEEYLTIGSGSSKGPVLIKRLLPCLRGVGIVCDEAGDPIVQREICELLSSALGIPSNRIYIAKGK